MFDAVSRRTLLGGVGALAAGAALGPALTGRADAAPAGSGAPEPTRYGTASSTGALICACVVGNSMFVGSRFGNPTGEIGEFDLATGELVRKVSFGEGTGTYKMAAGDGVIYVGLTNDPYIREYSIATGEVRTINPGAPIGPATTWVYDLFVSPDGKVFCGTYPEGKAWEIDPATGQVRDWGAVSTARYCTAVATDDEWLWVGSTVPGKLLALRRDGSERRDLTASLPKPGASIWRIALHDGVAYVATDRYVARVSLDGQATVWELPEKDRLVDGITVTPDGEVLASARNSCTMYRIENGLVDLGSPVVADENRLVDRLDDGTLVGVAGSGLIWKLDASGATTRYDVAAAGFAMPEKAQSMAIDRVGRIWVGGHFSATVHTVGHQTTSRRIHLAGEPKAITVGPGNTMYAALYPSTEVVAISPELEVTRFGFLRNGQYRPTAAGYDRVREQIVFSSGGVAGSNQGAVTFLDLESGEFDVRRDVLVGMKAADLWLDSRTLYVVGDTVGEQNPPPEREWAEIAAVDLDSRKVLWRHETVGHKRLSGVCVSGGLVYVLAYGRPATWFALDATTREETTRGTVSGQGDLHPITGSDGPVYALTHFSNAITRLPSKPGESQQSVYDTLPNGWFNNPMAVVDRRHSGTWGMHGLDLAWFPIPS